MLLAHAVQGCWCAVGVLLWHACVVREGGRAGGLRVCYLCPCPCPCHVYTSCEFFDTHARRRQQKQTDTPFTPQTWGLGEAGPLVNEKSKRPSDDRPAAKSAWSRRTPAICARKACFSSSASSTPPSCARTVLKAAFSQGRTHVSSYLAASAASSLFGHRDLCSRACSAMDTATQGLGHFATTILSLP